MKRLTAFLVFLISTFILIQPLLALEDEDQRYQSTSETMPIVISEFIREPIENLELEFFAGNLLGYDNNMYLNHYDKVGSLFDQSIFSTEATYPMPVWEWIKVKLGYDLTHIIYFRNSDADLLDNVFSGGVETVLYDIFTLDVTYDLDLVNYPKDEQSNYIGNQVEAGVKYDLTDWLYNRLSWEYLYKDYSKRKIWNNLYTIKLGDREDWRHTLESETGLTLFDSTLLKLSNKLYYSDSNDAYYDYYDYHAYKLSGSVIHIITDKLSGMANFSYQRKSYDQRAVSDKDEAQRDHLYTYGGSLLYDITPALSVGITYTYRKNKSNENDQQYSGSIVSTGLYYSF